MNGNITFSMIKPTATQNNHTGHIINMITNAGFHVIAIKMLHLSKDQAKAFYGVHEGKEFFERLIDFMSSGPIVAMVLKKENAVEDYRKLMGATDPAKAAEGTIRKLYATSMTMNAVHGSDSDENASLESRFFFSDFEVFKQL
ncbi:nucleoside-diphosphate kinase [Williamwhitmania taraxaci]|uniref:Nucleoside diphosphate kinase n=1 Tax=Williamwhitmania taraxaci TaxID=1640674 RepID=A0A1G6QCZ4_9BACT|nr:nucleoside-diphosphate kinase [Williamwhitmania taraxaci]SDC90173.1 nucleoside diphosphate kinase [Williamwhitmania taraxaci]